MTSRELIDKYKPSWDSITEREKATREKEIWDATDHLTRRQYDRREYIATFMGGTQAKVQIREALINAGSAGDILWQKIEQEGMLPATAHRLLREAKARVVPKKETLIEGLGVILAEYDALPVAKTGDGRAFRRRNPSHIKRPVTVVGKSKKKGTPKEDDSKTLFSQMREIIAGYVAGRLEGIDPIMGERLWQTFSKDLNTLLGDFSRKVYRVARQERTEVALKVEVGRREVLDACATLRMNAPKIGRPVDLAMAKRQKRSLARLLHPDSNSGDHSLADQYDEVVKAFDVLEQYNESFQDQGRKEATS